MPIKIKCQCGKALAVKDEFAGKAVKCPACGKGIRVPAAGGAAAPAPAAPAPVAPAAQAVGTVGIGNPMNELFDEEGFDNNIAAVCPNCANPMEAEAVLCTKCGFNKTTGETMQGHLTPGIDISVGDLALQKAENDMHRATKMQKDMTERSGMPWWMLGLILFILGSATALAVMVVMARNQTTGDVSFNAMAVFLQLSGTAFAMVALGALLKLIVEGFKESQKTGFLCCTVLYLFVFTFQQPKSRIGKLLVLIIASGVSGALFARSQQV